MKKNLPLIAGIAIPVALILFVAGSIYLPGIFIKPQYNFLYATGGIYGGAVQYRVTNGHLTVTSSTAAPNGVTLPAIVPPALTFYIYNVMTDQSQEISPADAANLSLDTNQQSPDGFSIATGNSGGGIFPFYSGGSDYNARYLEGHNISRKLNLAAPGAGYPYSYDFTFIGWIKNQ